jgi:transcriptional regulator with GAF, ATPase, and Fis domain
VDRQSWLGVYNARAMPAVPSAPSADLQAALSSVARAIADSLELTEVWDRVADACRAVVPFDAMGVSLLQPGDRVRVLVAAGGPVARDLGSDHDFARDDFSPRVWPRDETFLVLVNDCRRELDPSFLADREMIALGFRSLLRQPRGHGGEMFGSMELVSREPGCFTEDHGRRLVVVAELVILALAHEKLAVAGRERRRRREALERLIPTLTNTLDVRAVFEQISQIAQEIIPHDYLSLGLYSEDGKRVRIHAKHGDDDVREIPEYAVPRPLEHLVQREYLVTRDALLLGGRRLRIDFLSDGRGAASTIDIDLDDFWLRLYRDLGMRSAVRASVRLNGAVVGGLEFNSRYPDRYTREDADLAVRVAEHVALALAHQRLAEESRRAVAAQEECARLEERVHVLVGELATLSPHRALGRSRRWRDVLAHATKVSPTDTTVLISGESGTGKEVVARFVHRGSSRKDGPFVALNCAALPEQLLESELFGHEKGAFTGALAARPGKIEQAEGGVLFLDEVGEMSPAVQAKFLRVLQEREFQRLGGTRTLRADVRVLAATNRNLKQAMAQGAFREDLYYRLAVFEIPLPPLRERPDDIVLLVEAFLEEIGRSVGRPAAGISQEVRDKLVAYPWPGNVRELRNAIERAVILCEGGLITIDHLPIDIAAASRTETAGVGTTAGAGAKAAPPPTTLGDAEREMILQALTRAGNNKSKAARLLGLTRAQLRSRIEKHGLRIDS